MKPLYIISAFSLPCNIPLIFSLNPLTLFPFLFPPSPHPLLLSHFLLSYSHVTLSSAALRILTFHLISHFALTIYSILIISLFYP